MRFYSARIFATLFLVIICLFSSCSDRYGILDYQNGDIVAVCEINGKYTVNIIKEGNVRTLQTLSPSEVAGVSFVFDPECTVTYDGLELKLSRDEVKGVAALCSVFDLDEGMIGAIGGTETDTVSFNSDTICYTVTYNSLSLPERIMISGDFDFDIRVLSIEYK